MFSHLNSASNSPASLRTPSNHLPSLPPPLLGLPVGFCLAAAPGWRPLITKSPTGFSKDFLSRLNYHIRQAVITQSLIYSGENCGEIVTEIARKRNTIFTLTWTYWVSLKLTPAEFMGFGAFVVISPEKCILHARLRCYGVSCLLKKGLRHHILLYLSAKPKNKCWYLLHLHTELVKKKKRSLKGQNQCRRLCDVTERYKTEVCLNMVFLQICRWSDTLLCLTAQQKSSMKKKFNKKWTCGSLDSKICKVTCTHPSSYAPSFPYPRFSKFKYWPHKTSDFFFHFCADCIPTDGIILLMI